MDYSFFDSLLDAIFVVDSKKRIKYCNESAATLCSSSVRRLTKGEGARIFDILQISDQDSFVSERGERGQLEPAPWIEVDLELVKKKIKSKTQVAVQPFKDPEGEDRWVFTFHDVTLEESLHQKYQGELEAKEEMISELKTARVQLEDYSKNLEKMVEERTEEVRQANAMLKAIMNSLGQGFLVFDKDGKIGEIYTKACLEVLETDPSNKTIAEVLRIKDEDLEQFSKWSMATFSQALPFASMKELAPQLFCHSKGKHITLDYFPIENEQKELKNIVLVATDRTREYEANMALEKERAFAQMIVKLIKNRTNFSDFLVSVESAIDLVKNIANSKEISIDFNHLFRVLHTIEGEAGAFHASEIRLEARRFQSFIEPFRVESRSHLDHLEVEGLKGHLEVLDEKYQNFLAENKDIFSVVLLEKSKVVEISVDEVKEFSSILQNFPATQELLEYFEDIFLKQDITKAMGHLNEVALQIALKQEKEIHPVEFINEGVRIQPDDYKDFLSSLVHAFRNAVDHGLESPSDRESIGKDRKGHIQVHSSYFQREDQKYISLSIQDDGRGIDPTQIKNKYLENHPSHDFEGMSDNDVVQLIFDPGFSSRDDVGEFSGRGVGMDAIKAEVIRLGGEIQVSSILGQGTQIQIVIPCNSRETVLAKTA